MIGKPHHANVHRCLLGIVMRLVLAAAAFAVVSMPAHGAGISSMFMMSGFCEQLRIDNEPLSGCQSKIMQMVYDTGRASLVAVADGVVYSFSGIDQRERNGKIYQGLDQVTIAGDSGTENYPVTGLCEFENPFDGKARFTCKAHAENGTIFNLVFTTDGTAPRDLATQ